MADAPPPAQPSYVHLPNKAIVVFNSGEDKVDKVTGKIFETFPNLSPADTDGILAAADVIKQSSRYHSTTLTEGMMAAMARLLSGAGRDAFPAIDLLRLASCHPSVCTKAYSTFWGGALDDVLAILEKDVADVAVSWTGGGGGGKGRGAFDDDI